MLYQQWPRLALANEGATTVVFTASLAKTGLRQLLGDDFNFEACLRMLSLDQQLRIRNARHDPAKALMLALFALVTLNYALYCAGVWLDFDPFRALPISVNEFGKPSLHVEHGPYIEYNSSSSNDVMAIVVQFSAVSPVGIDLSHESQSSISETSFVEQFLGIFAPLELDQLAAVKDIRARYAFFNQLWTLKEAFTKFVGCGLNVDLASFNFQVGTDRPILTNPQVTQGPHFNVLQIEWQRDIYVDFERLDPAFKTRIGSGPVYCQTSVLKAGNPLPVFISLVSQNPMGIVQMLDLDLERVVQSIIDS